MNIHHSSRLQQKGLSLIELMIAMVIGLVLLAGVIGIFLSTQQTNRTQEAMSRVQESARIAIELIARDIRESGQSICAGSESITNLLDPTQSDYPDFFFDEMNPFTAPAAIADALPNRHILATNRFGSTGTYTVGNPGGGGGVGANNVSPQIQLQPAHNLERCQLVMVAGPEGMQCEIFANNVNSSVQVHRGPGNCGDYRNLSPSDVNRELVDYAIGDEIEIFTVLSRAYYIANNDNNIATLFRTSDPLTNDDDDIVREELVEGIFDMRIEYGIDTNGDGDPNRFAFANALVNPQWDRFVAVRIHLLVYNGLENNVVDAPQTIHFAGEQRVMIDRRLYQAFTTTIAVRNAREVVN